MAAQRSNTPGGLEEQCDQRVGRAKQLDFIGKEYLGKGASHGAPRHVHLEVLLCPNKCKRVRNRYLTLNFLFSTRPLCAFRELLKNHPQKERGNPGGAHSRWKHFLFSVATVKHLITHGFGQKSTWKTFAKIDHILSHETNFPNFERSKL